jgi:hypothetical protein
VRDYLAFVETQAAACHASGLDAFEAAREIGRAMGVHAEFGGLGEAGRIAVNVETVYRSLDPAHESPDVIEQFRRMAALERASG